MFLSGKEPIKSVGKGEGKLERRWDDPFITLRWSNQICYCATSATRCSLVASRYALYCLSALLETGSPPCFHSKRLHSEVLQSDSEVTDGPSQRPLLMFWKRRRTPSSCSQSRADRKSTGELQARTETA